jgi:predicted DNA-binding transcriptional regulator AlpA
MGMCPLSLCAVKFLAIAINRFSVFFKAYVLHEGDKEHLMSDTFNTLIPAPAVAAELGINPRTLNRWMRDETLDFPTPLKIKTRNYFPRQELDVWKAARMRASLRKVG